MLYVHRHDISTGKYSIVDTATWSEIWYTEGEIRALSGSIKITGVLESRIFPVAEFVDYVNSCYEAEGIDTRFTLTSHSTKIGISYISLYTVSKSEMIFTVPDFVVSISDNCFRNCLSLTSVYMSNDVEFLGDSCFYYCTSLTEVRLSNSLTSLPDNCFYGCSSLTTIIYDGIFLFTGIDCFWGCYNFDLGTLNLR